MPKTTRTISSKYVHLLSKCYRKYKNLSFVDTKLNPLALTYNKEIKKVILEQTNRNEKRCRSSFPGELLKTEEEIRVKSSNVRRKKKIVVSSSCKKKLHSINYQREINFFTVEEDEKIIKAINDSKGRKLMISKLCQEINRPYHSTRDRVRKLRNESSKRNARRFTIIEDKIILDEVLQYIDQENLREIPLPNPQKLSHLLKRRETSLKSRWQYYLKPMLLQFYSKTLNLDIRQMLVNYIAQKYKSLDLVDWEEVIKVPEFSGHTDSSVKYQYFLLYHILRQRKVIGKESTLVDVAKAANEYFTDTKRRYSQAIMEHKTAVITYFENYVKLNKIDNFH